MVSIEDFGSAIGGSDGCGGIVGYIFIIFVGNASEAYNVIIKLIFVG